MPIGQILLDRNVVDPEQLEAARNRQKVAGGSLAESLVAMGLISPFELEELLGEAPAEPHRLAETGLGAQFAMNFLLKAIYTYGFETAAQLAEATCLSEDVVDEVLEAAKEKRLVEVLGLTPDRPQVYRYALSEAGRRWAVEALEQCQYTGPAPVPLAAYQAQVIKQSIAHERVTPAALRAALAHLVLPEETIPRMGPAVNSAKAALFYGPPGNGKSSVAEALGSAFRQTVFIPHCIEVDGQIIKIFDPTIHEPTQAPGEEALDGAGAGADPGVDDAGGPDSGAMRPPTWEEVDIDRRWVRCRRPVILTGGELTLEMLDLSFDPVSKYYEAPAHIKAVGGIFIIDDFGRQLVRPRDLLNRWILPLERRVDFLTLHTGKKLKMPFDELVIFSTNFPPKELMDEAGLRRIPYKFHMAAPTPEEYAAILRRVCDAHQLALPTEVVPYLLNDFYPKTGTPRSCAHPKFIVEHVIARCHFSGEPPRLDIELLRDALQNLIVEDTVSLKGDASR